MPKLQEAWKELSASVLNGVPLRQKQEMRRAFFMGALSMVQIAMEASECESEDEACQMLASADAEMKQFSEQIGKPEELLCL